MKRNMNEWMNEYLQGKNHKPLPILSFPGTQLIGKNVEELVRSGHNQALCMEAIANKFDTGAAFSLMDLSVEAEAFGSPIIYSKDDIPTLHGALIHDEEEAEALQIPEVGAGRTGECVQGIREASEKITDRPVLAGIIGPYSLAGRLLDMTEIMILCYEEPELVETVLEKATQFLIAYAKAFKAAGANGIAMAEPAAGLLSPTLIREFSNPYVKRVQEAVEDENFLFLYHNCGTVTPLMKELEELNVHAYSFGNAIDLEDALKTLPSDRLIIGNIDPAGVIRNGTPELIEQETRALLEKCSKYPNFVLASGCDIPPQTSMENLEAFFRTAEQFYR
ncbi:uroporphyrinogen decarboxylase family protein [Blautia sp. HCP3S3_G3]|uniref:uroporphyrinogen decarboxylase family protein n=1 Tax=Blautia sp. HCP3S3_G3 TaxID=3438913 RepID=UPI003F8CDE83